ncbi:hypothetical protein [Raoultella ornithinolytica]|uniref:hypothetical protein n=1 Tax=Raoultella ornithinolytica TaxID=54291 RepID=UPI00235017C2|nr:hypothetical protein [Raoultella ornithinolytica]MDC7944490.1 hypothetical protein [Raoultella ornithinolytica]
MTKSTITRERIEQYANDPRMCNINDEIRELASMALAAMDSDPVIIVGDDGGDALSYRRLIQSFEPGTKLYRHAQQPVVPEKATVGEMPFLGVSEGVYVRGWNDCRAAMLNGGKS